MTTKCYLVVKHNYAGMIMTVLAVFKDKDQAHAWKDNVNHWYGEGHPLVPLAVVDQSTLFEPNLFPVEAFEKAFPK